MLVKQIAFLPDQLIDLLQDFRFTGFKVGCQPFAEKGVFGNFDRDQVDPARDGQAPFGGVMQDSQQTGGVHRKGSLIIEIGQR